MKVLCRRSPGARWILPRWRQFSALTLSVRSIRPNPLRVFPSCPFCPPGLRPSFFSPSLAFSGFLSKSVEGGFDDVLLSLSRLPFSFSMVSPCLTTNSCNFSTISTSCSGVRFFRLSLSSSCCGSFCFILSIYTFFCFCQSPDLNPYIL